MGKLLLVIAGLVMALIYIGNYVEFKKGRISGEQLNRKNRASVFLIFLLIAAIYFLRKRL